MRKFGNLLFWTLIVLFTPMAAFAAEGGGDASWGYALGAAAVLGEGHRRQEHHRQGPEDEVDELTHFGVSPS